MWVDVLGSLLRDHPGIELVEAHTSAKWVDHAVATEKVDVVLLHLDGSGHPLSERVRSLAATSAATRVVGLGEGPDIRLLLSAVRAGVRGWVEPSDSVQRLVRTLHGVARGETWLPRAALTEILDALTTTEEAREQLSTALSVLSAREVDILCCLAHGMTRQEIAERYILSTHTVRTHINNLLRKLNVHSTLAAVSLAREGGLVDTRSAP